MHYKNKLFYWAGSDERWAGDILHRYRGGRVSRERDSKEPGFSHTAGAVSRTIAVNWRNPFACIASDIHWSVDCYQNGIFYNTIARQ